jgi:hypothetical protein
MRDDADSMGEAECFFSRVTQAFAPQPPSPRQPMLAPYAPDALCVDLVPSAAAIMVHPPISTSCKTKRPIHSPTIIL